MLVMESGELLGEVVFVNVVLLLIWIVKVLILFVIFILKEVLELFYSDGFISVILNKLISLDLVDLLSMVINFGFIKLLFVFIIFSFFNVICVKLLN